MNFQHINVPGLDEELPTVQEVKPVDPKPGKKRGRPRKDQQPAQPAQPQQQQQHQPANDIFEKIKSEIDANQVVDPLSNPVSAPVQVVSTPSILDGYMILSFMDAFFPGIIKFLFKKKLQNVDVSKLMLSEAQKNSLEPLADEMAKQISGYISPTYAFFLAAGSMYYQNSLKYAAKT